MPVSAIRLQPEWPRLRQKLCDKWAVHGADRRCRVRADRHGSGNRYGAFPARYRGLRYLQAVCLKPCVRPPCKESGEGACLRQKYCGAWPDEWIRVVAGPGEAAFLMIDR